MSLFGQTLILYAVIGAGVAGAIYLTGGPDRWFRAATAVPFWPLYLPLLLTTRRADALPTVEPHDELSIAISQVNAELNSALESLDDTMRGKLRIGDLRAAWMTQARRIREMDRILALPEPNAENPAAERVEASRHARHQNLERLQQLRRRAADDLLANLASVRELVSRIHLAKFSGAPAARAEELVAQISAVVEGMNESEHEGQLK